MKRADFIEFGAVACVIPRAIDVFSKAEGLHPSFLSQGWYQNLAGILMAGYVCVECMANLMVFHAYYALRGGREARPLLLLWFGMLSSLALVMAPNIASNLSGIPLSRLGIPLVWVVSIAIVFNLSLTLAAVGYATASERHLQVHIQPTKPQEPQEVEHDTSEVQPTTYIELPNKPKEEPKRFYCSCCQNRSFPTERGRDTHEGTMRKKILLAGG